MAFRSALPVSYMEKGGFGAWVGNTHGLEWEAFRSLLLSGRVKVLARLHLP
jgi:hypothetical protein